MTRIVYKIVDNRGEMRSFDADVGCSVEIEIVPSCSGFISVGAVSSPLVNGTAVIDLSRMSDGVYTPILYAGRAIPLEPLCRERGRLVFPGTPDESVRSLLLRMELAEENIKRLEGALGEMRSRLGDGVIF